MQKSLHFPLPGRVVGGEELWEGGSQGIGRIVAHEDRNAARM